MEGLNVLAQRMASACDIHYGKRALKIDVKEKEICFSDGSTIPYQTLVSTLPLNKMLEMAGLKTAASPDPSPSVLVLNIGALKGSRCPKDHWVYVPASRAGFHRVGFYSNVDAAFLPKLFREVDDSVSIYVEKAYAEGSRPTPAQVSELSRDVVNELQDWGWIREVDVIDPTWIEVAYTWSRPGSHWRQEALTLLESHDIYQVGRYARWVFQGIADSVREGLMVGAAISSAEGQGAAGTRLSATCA
jgi:protoporphyrinogen oxidase